MLGTENSHFSKKMMIFRSIERLAQNLTVLTIVYLLIHWRFNVVCEIVGFQHVAKVFASWLVEDLEINSSMWTCGPLSG